MRLVISTIAILSLICTLASCARGGNVDKGNDGHIGKDQSSDQGITTNEPKITDDKDLDDDKKGSTGDKDMIPDGDVDITGDNSNDNISGRMNNGPLDGFDPDTLIPDGMRR